MYQKKSKSLLTFLLLCISETQIRLLDMMLLISVCSNEYTSAASGHQKGSAPRSVAASKMGATRNEKQKSKNGGRSHLAGESGRGELNLDGER
jgi:hypothetical protein